MRDDTRGAPAPDPSRVGGDGRRVTDRGDRPAFLEVQARAGRRGDPRPGGVGPPAREWTGRGTTHSAESRQPTDRGAAAADYGEGRSPRRPADRAEERAILEA